MSDIDNAINIAEKMLKAVAAKFPKYAGKVRRFDTADGGFIELELTPEGQVRGITTAYSDEFFLSANKDNANDKARRILNDFKILLGAK